MALFDLKKLRETVEGAAKAITSTVKDGAVGDAIDSVTTAIQDGVIRDAIDTVSSAVKDVKIPEIKLPEVKLSELDPVQAVDLIKSKIGHSSESSQRDVAETGLSAKDALRIFYYLMSVDGELLEEELGGFYSICTEMCLDHEIDKDALIAECKADLEAISNLKNPIISAMLCSDRILRSPNDIPTDKNSVTPKLLIWDLFAIAYSDGSCNDLERELISYIANALAIDDSILLEMESSSLTLLDVDREIRWLKTTDQPYLVIEAQIQELEARKAAVQDGVRSLIAL